MWARSCRLAARAGGCAAATGFGALLASRTPAARAEDGAPSGLWGGGAQWAAAETMEGLAVRAADLNSLVVKILLAAGSDADEAQIVADNLVESNLKGHDSHGVGCEFTQRRPLPPYALTQTCCRQT